MKTEHKPCPLTLPLKVSGNGADSWLEDAGGFIVIESTRGLTDEQHRGFLEWVAEIANGEFNPCKK
jgi:hypothetical protein